MRTINNATLEAMRTTFSAIFNLALKAVVTHYEKFCMIVPSTAKKQTYNWLDILPAMREWVGDRVIHALKAEGYTLTNVPYELTIGVHREDIEDDELGIYNPVIQTQAERCLEHRDKLAFEALMNGFSTDCFDGQSFFDDDHEVNGASVSNTGGGSGRAWFVLVTGKAVKPIIMQVRKQPEYTAMDKLDDEAVFSQKLFRYGTDDRKVVGYGFWQMGFGSKDTLNEANLKAAITAIKNFTDDHGEPLNLVPDTLIVSETDYFTAKELMTADFLSDGLGGTKPNTLKGELPNLISSPRVT